MTGYNIEIHSWLQGLGNKLLLKEIILSFRYDIYISCVLFICSLLRLRLNGANLSRPGRRVTIKAKSTLLSVSMRKQFTPLPEPTAKAHALTVYNRARARSDYLA